MDPCDLGRTFRSKSGQRRITYRPDWSKELPWVAYYKGSAGMHFASFESAQTYHAKFGDPLILTEKSNAS